jgi:uncharacterized protein YecE (DUF72 family)
MLRIGTAGWKYKDWEGIVYPKPKPRGFDELQFLSNLFSTVEINSSFYGPPRPSAAKKWVESVQHVPSFRFTAKLYQSFTHARNRRPRMKQISRTAYSRLWTRTNSGRSCCSSRSPLRTNRRTAIIC